MILGIDEVGRGPWAGPLVVGAVVLPNGLEIDGLTDSKKLSAAKRQKLNAIIQEKAVGYGLGWVHPQELDDVGLSQALRLATIRAVQAVSAPYHQIIIDGTVNFLRGTEKGKYVQTLPKADALIPAVSAASIIAKVARDTYMIQQDKKYPEYGFSAHVGYGTARHRQALEQYGVTSLHRRSFAPIARLLNEAKSSTSRTISTATPVRITTKKLGDAAEVQVSGWLERNGFTIIERNWRTRRCEIDCIADKNDIRYFIEVKYRSSTRQGGGVAAVTPRKLQQMTFAAELYAASHKYTGNMRLAVVSVNARSNIVLIEVT